MRIETAQRAYTLALFGRYEVVAANLERESSEIMKCIFRKYLNPFENSSLF